MWTDIYSYVLHLIVKRRDIGEQGWCIAYILDYLSGGGKLMHSLIKILSNRFKECIEFIGDTYSKYEIFEQIYDILDLVDVKLLKLLLTLQDFEKEIKQTTDLSGKHLLIGILCETQNFSQKWCVCYK